MKASRSLRFYSRKYKLDKKRGDCDTYMFDTRGPVVLTSGALEYTGDERPGSTMIKTVHSTKVKGVIQRAKLLD